MNLNMLVESRIKEIESEQERLLKDPTINKIVESVGECVKNSQGRELTLHEQRTIAQCLWNAVDQSAAKSFGKTKALRAIFEATTEDAISFLGIPKACAA